MSTLHGRPVYIQGDQLGGHDCPVDADLELMGPLLSDAREARLGASWPTFRGALDALSYFHDSGNMEPISAVTCLSALAQEHRLHVFRLLVEAGNKGMSVGELATATHLPGATLTNHLHILRRAGLVADERRGRVIQCRANYGQMNSLIGFLTENCCAGSGGPEGCSPVATCAPRRTP